MYQSINHSINTTAPRPEYIENSAPDSIEKRVLNFLCQEYLIATDCRLSAVTFAEENHDQV